MAVYTLTQNQTTQALKVALEANTPCMLTSSPGLGKSAIIKQIAEEYNLKLIDIRLSQITHLDLLGFPKEINGKMSYVPMDIIPLDTDPLPKKADGTSYDGFLIFLDEFNSADKYVQGAAYRLLLDREIGNYKMHPHARILMAGNRQQDMAVVNTIVSPVKSRITHLEMELSTSEFQEFVGAQVQKGTWEPVVLGFINYRPSLISNFDAKTIGDVVTYACPRSWEMLSKQISAGLLKLPEEISTPIITGIIGEEAANDFINFLTFINDLPTVDEIKADPKNCTMPNSIGAKWALSAYIYQHIDASNANELVEYIERIKEEDIKVVIYRTILPKYPLLAQNPLVQKSLGLLRKKLAKI